MPDFLISVVTELPESFNLRNLERTRKARGWTRPYLAEVSGVKLETIKLQENGSAAASLETAWRLSKALGVSIDVLLLALAGGAVVRNTGRRKHFEAHGMKNKPLED